METTQNQPTGPTGPTGRISPGRGARSAATFALAAVCGAFLGAVAVRTVAAPATDAPCARGAAADPYDQSTPERRMANSARYLERWNRRAGPDGYSRVPVTELRGCYNLLTQGELPDPARVKERLREDAGL